MNIWQRLRQDEHVKTQNFISEGYIHPPPHHFVLRLPLKGGVIFLERGDVQSLILVINRSVLPLKPLFKQSSLLGLHAIFLIFFALVLMVFDRQFPYFSKIRSQMMVVIYPLQVVIDQPTQFFLWLQNSVSAQQEVLAENAQLRARQLLLQAKLQRLLVIERENLQLRELLNSSSHLAGKVVIAQLLAVDLDPLTREVTLDKGSRDGVFHGQPVLDAYGVMGQVIEVGPFTCRILLINDGRSAIPVQNNRNGLRSVAAGTNFTDRLALLNMPITADIVKGDLFVTSGLGGKFPYGYPIGRVVSVEQKSGGRFADILLEPSAHVGSSRLVMLVWPSEE